MNPRHGLGALRSAIGFSAFAVCVVLPSLGPAGALASGLRAGAGRADITDETAGPVHDRLQVKVLLLADGTTTVVWITVDAVAIGEIGPIGNGYLPSLRSRMEREFGIPPENVLVNASHCHGRVAPDVEARTMQAVKDARESLVPVNVGSGVGREDRIQQNRRIRLRGGGEADERHAYSLPPGDDVVGTGPIDPEIGILRFDRKDGRTLALVYNFACHPIQGVPGGGNTADLVGFASKVIEDGLGEGSTAIFLQGSAGDINPIQYKDVAQARNAEPLGILLGLSTLEAARKIECREDGRLTVLREVLALPRADLSGRIASMETERERLLEGLQGTSLDFETFVPLYVKYKLGGDYPSAPAHRYLHDRSLGRDELDALDRENRRNMELYIGNIRALEALTRVQTNLSLLKKHQAINLAAATKTVEAELMAFRIEDFVLVTFPGELTVEIGLALKEKSPHEKTFVAAYTNGYLYYAPTAKQLGNPGGAQEDCDCLLAPEWQKVYEEAADRLLRRL